MKLFYINSFCFVILFFTGNNMLIGQNDKSGSCGEHFVKGQTIWNANDPAYPRTFSPVLFSDKAPRYYSLCIFDQGHDTVYRTDAYYREWNGRRNNRTGGLKDGLYFWAASYANQGSNDTFSCIGQLECINLNRLQPISAGDTGECAVYIPNAFTPNEDAVNDEWFPRFSCDPVYYHLELYDRWGELIWETRDPLKGWDGTIQKTNSIAEEDTYVYRITFNYASNTPTRTMLGHVSLIK